MTILCSILILGKDELNKLGLIYIAVFQNIKKLTLSRLISTRTNYNHFSEISVDHILKSRYILSLYCWGQRDQGEKVHICSNIPVKSSTYIFLFPKGNFIHAVELMAHITEKPAPSPLNSKLMIVLIEGEWDTQCPLGYASSILPFLVRDDLPPKT